MLMCYAVYAVLCFFFFFFRVLTCCFYGLVLLCSEYRECSSDQHGYTLWCRERGADQMRRMFTRSWREGKVE